MKETSLQSEQVKSTTDDPTRTKEAVDDIPAGQWHYDNPGVDPAALPEGAVRRRNNPETGANEEQIYKRGEWLGYGEAI